MPAKGTSKITHAQRKKIAIGKVTGKTLKQVAKETGLAPKTIDNQHRDPRTTVLIQELKARHSKQLEEMFKLSLDRVEGMLKDKKEESAVVLRAAQTAIDLVNAGEAPLRAVIKPTKGGDFTYIELLAVQARVLEGGEE